MNSKIADLPDEKIHEIAIRPDGSIELFDKHGAMVSISSPEDNDYAEHVEKVKKVIEQYD